MHSFSKVILPQRLLKGDVFSWPSPTCEYVWTVSGGRGGIETKWSPEYCTDFSWSCDKKEDERKIKTAEIHVIIGKTKPYSDTQRQTVMQMIIFISFKNQQDAICSSVDLLKLTFDFF